MNIKMKKWLIAGLVIIGALVLSVMISPMSKQQGAKSVTITVLNDETGTFLLENKVFTTDAKSLGEFIFCASLKTACVSSTT